jgi:hypothetical protein
MDNLYFTTDGAVLWLEHFPDGTDSEETCDGSPICPVEAGDTLAQVIAKAEAHTCG